MRRFFHDMQRYRRYMFYSAKAQLKNEVAGSFLNRLWWILDPLLFMLVYTFVYSIVFGRKQDFLCAFIFLGYCSWEFFNRSINQSVKIVKKYKAVVSKVYLPKFVLILSSMMVNAFKMGISLGIVAITLILYQVPLRWTMLWFFPYLLLLFLLTFGFSCFLLHCGVFFEDLANIVRVGLRLLFYMSGIFYVITDRVDKAIATLLLKVNPVGFLIDACRQALVYSSTPHRRLILFWFVVGVLLSAIGIVTIYKNENNYVKVI